MSDSSVNSGLPKVYVLRRSVNATSMFTAVSTDSKPSKRSHVRKATSTIAKCKSSLMKFLSKERSRTHDKSESSCSSLAPSSHMCGTGSGSIQVPALDQSLVTRDTSEVTDFPSLQHASRRSDNSDMPRRDMIEKDLYNLHLRAYMEETMKECLGDLQICDDLDFLFDDPDEFDDCPSGSDASETESNGSQRGSVPMFEICVPIFSHKSPLPDDCSEITHSTKHKY